MISTIRHTVFFQHENSTFLGETFPDKIQSHEELRNKVKINAINLVLNAKERISRENTIEVKDVHFYLRFLIR